MRYLAAAVALLAVVLGVTGFVYGEADDSPASSSCPRCSSSARSPSAYASPGVPDRAGAPSTPALSLSPSRRRPA
ncbi:hypothetical protein V2I01_36115 [Micromonospora sp. BRA006-A]|nr:hypothetical protein [Micromonospora sp. BRA006-A]